MSSQNLKSQISNLKSYSIIVAGGSGTRMQSAIPKQFLLLKGRPVLMYTIEAFYNCDSKPEIIIVLPAAFHDHWAQLCIEYNFTIQYQLVNGGETRFHSVKNGLTFVNAEPDALVAIHDAVRPLTGKHIIDSAYRHAAEHGNAVVAVKSRDSVRQLKAGISKSLVRDEIYLIQTPQTFRLSQLTVAYARYYDTKFTDDASVVEEAGFQINLVEGDHRNIKITFPEDIAVAELFLVDGR